jgi:hypothetical protein
MDFWDWDFCRIQATLTSVYPFHLTFIGDLHHTYAKCINFVGFGKTNYYQEHHFHMMSEVHS